MRRRDFLGTAIGAAVMHAGAFGSVFSGKNAEDLAATFSASISTASYATTKQSGVSPMAIGVMIAPSFDDPEAAIARVKELGMSNCFLSLDDYIGRFSPTAAEQLSAALKKHGVIATSAEVVGPGRLVWDFWDGPETIGLVPPATRAARIEALKQTSDFVKQLGIPRVQTHCGFIPENPRDPLYQPTVHAIREVAIHCAGNGQDFLMETGQETPTTMSRAILDVNQPNLGVGLDTANLILYGKANPVDAVGIIGPHVRSVHAKDGMWPTDPMKLGKEVLIGTGRVDFLQVFSKLHNLGYQGAITIERETSGPQQMEDVKHEKLYLERVLAKVRSNQA
ncbi:MAG TPA: sugar phosphate isomerase/epimerase family protein [Acidobacteriaceae bacterium]|nr:sugar phosphate isomerase/epimerase family protein [Acidobacteriaceae bacterium]